MNETRRHDFIALAILAALITLLFSDVLFGNNSLYVRDLLLFHYPTKHVLREVLLAGEFPHWNPWVGAGQPMAANPQHEVFYPPNWLILLPSYRLGFHLLVILHVALAAFAMYALLRSMSTRPPAAFAGAVSFALGGIGLSYLSLLPFLFSAAWLPLTCLYTRRFLKTGSRRAFALASLFFGIQVLIGEPTTILQTGLLLGMFAIASSHSARDVFRNVAAVGLISLAALLFSAAQTIPAIDLARDSVRARGFAYKVVTEWSLPPIRLGELFHADLLGHVNVEERMLYWAARLYPDRGLPFLSSIYPGVLLSVLAVAGTFARVRGRRLFLAIAAVSVLLALGMHTPLWRGLYELGLVNALRFPEKFILMAVFAVIVFGSRTLDELLGGNEAVRKAALVVAGVLAAVFVVMILLSRTTAYLPFFTWLWRRDAAQFPAMVASSAVGWLVALARCAAVLLLVRNVMTTRREAWLAIAGVFLVLDLGMVFSETMPRMPASYYDPPELAKLLPQNRAPWRLFHHASWHTRRSAAQPYNAPHEDRMWIDRNAMFPMLPALYGVRMALDVDYDLTSLTPTADFMQSAADLSAYRKDWADVAASMSNVWYRAAFRNPAEAFAAARGDLRLVQPVGLLKLPHYPRYSFAGHLEPITDRMDFVRKLASRRFDKTTAFVSGEAFAPAAGRVLSVCETVNTARIEVESEGRAFLVISVTPHKYWRITIDGAEARAVSTNVGYQGVVIPSAGRHVVEMRYRNPLFPIGGAITMVTLLGLLMFGVRRQGLRFSIRANTKAEALPPHSI